MKGVYVAAFLSLASLLPAQAQSVGEASYYRPSRAGELVAAHRTLPFGARVRVTNLANGRVATLIVVDRGPFIRNRIIDVSTNAADVLGFRRAGIAKVRIEIVDLGLRPAAQRP
ncbi:MAG TPA: septal ring lytic transglycosylase RlpA family protein [Roseiarcus sp.]|nr:septal ring lytic transglycosylase RlpA family protein [Roseiarcus sp.]